MKKQCRWHRDSTGFVGDKETCLRTSTSPLGGRRLGDAGRELYCFHLRGKMIIVSFSNM